jgi:hypothetical protein
MAHNSLDPTFIIQVQIAIIGVVLVTGLFYIWRTVCRIEDKVDRMRFQPSFPPPNCEMRTGSGPAVSLGNGFGSMIPDMDSSPEDIMKSVFGDIFVLGGGQGQGQVRSGVEVTEITDEPASGPDDEDVPLVVKESVPVVSEPDESHEIHDNEDEAPSVSGGALTKTKLNRMHLNMLKELCTQRGLSPEGTKPVLVDRIMASV